MENRIVKKVIRASAGTGKTYRISLEFINLLLTYKERINFDEIMIITFTKKATAEIRERIFSHIKILLNKKSERKFELIESLNKINPYLTFTKEDYNYLLDIYRLMITNKSKLRISTIDSFINNIFSEVVTRYYNIYDFEIDNEINDNYLPELFDTILDDKYIHEVEQILTEKKGKNISLYEGLVKDIINNRWIFQQNLSNKINNNETDIITKKSSENFREYKNKIDNIFTKFILYLKDYLANRNKKIIWEKYLTKDFYGIIQREIDIDDLSLESFKQKIIKLLTDTSFVNKYYNDLLDTNNFWNGRKLLRRKADSELKKELQENLCFALENLANYLFYKKFLPEQKRIIRIADLILKKYDRIKLRDKIFTYNDISYYTYDFLHNPALSIIDDKNVLNLFYENLSYRTRFILIDEFQDTSILQWNVLYPLISEVISGMGQKDYGGVIIVGDEKQSIYGWRGGERELLLSSLKFFGLKHSTQKLNISYRSTTQIIDFVNLFFGSKYLHDKLKKNGIFWGYNRIISNITKKQGYVEVHLRSLLKKADSGKVSISKFTHYQESIGDILKPLIISNSIDISKTAILARTNKELKEIATVLDEFDISYVLESSSSLFNHRCIKPILIFLRYLVYEDYYQLAAFLRSDVILMDACKLKRILVTLKKLKSSRDNNESTKYAFYKIYKNDVIINKIANIEELKKSKGILDLVKIIIEEFQIHELFSTQADLQNINKFLEVIADFEKKHFKYPKNLFGFIDFCKDKEASEDYVQESLLETQAIKLLTIHKSKGLEFDTVFSFFDVRASHGNYYSGLNEHLHYNKYYSGIKEVLITYNYKKILEHSQKKIVNAKKIRDYVETLNNYYVSLTRAKFNLFVFAYMGVKQKVEKYLSGFSKDKNVSIPKLLFYSFIQENKGKLDKISDGYIYLKFGEKSSHKMDDKKINNKSSISKNAAKYFSIDLPSLESYATTKLKNDYKKKYIDDKSLLYGNIVHYYLSNIYFDSSESRKRAKDKTIAFYGTLLHREIIEDIIKKVNDFISDNYDYYNSNKWDQVYNEFIIFAPSGEEYRIDRLLIDKKNKKILVLDYKTGEEFDKEQLNNYIKIIRDVAYVKDNKYSVRGEFRKINI